MNHKYLYLLLLFLIVSCQRNVETGPPVLKEMCQRLFPRHAQSFLFELLTDSIDTDRFILESELIGCRFESLSEKLLSYPCFLVCLRDSGDA